MPSEAEREILAHIKEAVDSSIKALQDNDMVCYEALAREEARLMDLWRMVRQAV